jgi:hypothetical protein
MVSATPAGASLFPATNASIRLAYTWYTLQNGPVRRMIRTAGAPIAYVVRLVVWFGITVTYSLGSVKPREPSVLRQSLLEAGADRRV